MKPPCELTLASWFPIIDRDASADRLFYYAVKTTGIYCRPSCRSRRPRPENIRIYATCAEAQQAGYRACKRCHPDRL